MAKKPKLTAKQKKFCDEYLLSMNATHAAKEAGYSEKTAGNIGSENLEKPYIKEYLAERRKKEEEASLPRAAAARSSWYGLSMRLKALYWAGGTGPTIRPWRGSHVCRC